MKIININPGILPIPPNGWGAIEKIIWDYHQEMNEIGVRNEIKYLDELKYEDNIVVHVHVANLANELNKKNIPYIFSIHDHHAYLYGKDSPVFKENLKAIENSVISLSPCKYLLPYFGNKKLRYFSHAVNTNIFKFNGRQRHHPPKLLCVANNGYAYDQSVDRKGFKLAIEAAMKLGLPLTIAGPNNNKNFFKTLSPELSNYVNLTKLYDLDEKWLINLYNEHDIFLHFSELEAGHPNLTLLEAMACGLPIVGTFEEPSYKGMYVTDRSIENAVKGIQTVAQDYIRYQNEALDNANVNSYKNKVLELSKVYSEYRERIFANNIISHYENTSINHHEPKNNIHINFHSGPKVEILGGISKKYKVKFINNDTGYVVYHSDLSNNMWSSANIRHFLNWKLDIYEVGDDNSEKLIDSHLLNLRGKKVKVVLDTESLGDLMAYIGAVDAFQKKHDCDLMCVVFRDELVNIFSKSYNNITFSRLNPPNDPFYAIYHVGYFDQNNWQGNAPFNPKDSSLATIAQDILGLPSVEIKPKLKFNISEKPLNKYVCIGTQSTAQLKYWNNPSGWADVVKYLNSIGYEVWCIDKSSSFGKDEHMNYIPFGAIDKTGNFSLEERMSQIYNSEFFIGLGSGLSWLSWAVHKNVVLISGFSLEFAEFFTPYRVINKNVCHGCWNDSSCTFDKGDWKWCPRKKDFECTKQINSEMVIDRIKDVINNEHLNNFDWGMQVVKGKYLTYDELFLKNKNVYERFFEVEKDDVVVDIGAHVGGFSYNISRKNPKLIVALEPSAIRFETLKNNLKNTKSILLNVGISGKNETIERGLQYDTLVENLTTITFRDFLDGTNLSHIDFLKVDCEGGEYDIFDENNLDWILSNVRKIACEFHLNTTDLKLKFNWFRSKILPRIKEYKVYSVDGKDIKWQLFTNYFTEYYRSVNFYIDNRN